MEIRPRILAFALLLCLPIVIRTARAEVYLNRVMIDPANKIWAVQELNIVGTSLTINREYQNDYGMEFDLPPGPPFIIEKDIKIYNLENSPGIFVVDANGMGAPFGAPFDLRFETSLETDIRTIDVRGSVAFRGTMMDPIMVKGVFRFVKPSQSLGPFSDSTDICEFTQCDFSPTGGDRYVGAPAFSFYYGQVSFDHCTFNGFDQTNPILCDDDFSQQFPPPTTFRMASCAVKNSVRGTPLLLLNARVSLVNNWFEGNTLTSVYASDKTLVNMEWVAIEEITGNYARDNTVNKLSVSFGFVVGKAHIRTSEDLPLVDSGLLLVEPSGDLEVGPGSVIKFQGGLRIKGKAVVEGSVLTAAADDDHGGDSDLLPPTGNPSWDSISVWKGGSLAMAGSQVLYCRMGIRAYGALNLDSCTILRASGGAGVWCLAEESPAYRISRCCIRDGANGVIIRPGAGQGTEVWLESDTLVQNTSYGVLLDLPVTGETHLAVRNCRIAGNRGDGIQVSGSPLLKSIQVKNCRLEANGGHGLYVNSASASPDLTIASNVVSGNGYLSGYKTGITVTGGKVRCSDNTIAWNAQAGLRVASLQAESSQVDNNLFYRNGYFGLWGGLPSSLAFNHFCGNAPAELSVSTSSGSIQTVEGLRALGGEFTTNQEGEARLESPIRGTVLTAGYHSGTGLSTLVATSPLFDGPAKKGVIVRPEMSQTKWYASVGGHADTLFVAGDIGATVMPGDTLELFDYRLASGSPLIDQGGNEKAVSLSDVDGNPRIIDGDRDNDKTVDIGAFEFGAEGVPPNPLAISAPAAQAFWLSGEPHDITWSASGISAVNLYIHLDYTSTNRSAWRRIAAGIPSSPGRYSWKPADTLISAKCKVMVADASDTTVNVKSDLFRMKPYLLTRLGADGSYEKYHPALDGWSFENSDTNMWPHSWWSQFDYVRGIDPNTGQVYPPYFSATHGPGALSALPCNFPDWLLFVSVFGKPACYYTIQSASIYKPSALLKWGAIKDSIWQGSCVGFAVSSYLAFDRKSSFLETYPDVGQFDRLYSRPFDPWIRKPINGLWLCQFGREQEAHCDTAAVRRPLQTLNDLRAMFLSEAGDNAYLSITDPDSGGHALSPYRLRRDQQFPDLYRVSVYDCNYPADTTLEVVIDTSANSWVYSHAQGWNAGSGCYLDIPASRYLVPPVPTSDLPAPGPALAKESADPSPATYLVGRSASVSIANSAGQAIGYPRQALPPAIPGAREIIIPRGVPRPPDGYRVPPGQYNVQLWGFTGAQVKLAVFSKSILFGYDRHDGSPGETDRLEIGDHCAITNPDTAEKSPQFQIITPEDTAEKAYYVGNLILRQNDSLVLKPGSARELDITNIGAGKTYDVRIVAASSAYAGEFLGKSIALGSNTTHRIEPSWTSVETSLLRILVDNGNDGVFEDTLRLRNELTGVPPRGAATPGAFELLPCYPNPFNPSTVIRYRVPVHAAVRLVVYDLLGREVAVLVSERKMPGEYEVMFDARGLASGIYLCRMTSEGFSHTRKLMLVR